MNDSARYNRFILLVIILGVFAAGLHAVPLGLSSHGDSRAVLERSMPSILHGHYAISRSYGNPLYELIAAGLYTLGGYRLINSYSLLLAVLSLCLFNALLGRSLPPARRICALAAFAFSPLFFVNIATTIEWMQMVFLLLCLLWLATRWLEDARPLTLAGIGLTVALIELTRPDAVFICLSVFLAMLWQLRFDLRRSVALFATLSVAAVATLAIFGIINGGFAFIQPEVFGGASFTRRVLIGIIGVFSVFGLAGAPAMVLITAYAAWQGRNQSASLPFWNKLFFIGLPLVLLRFMILPDKLEYVISLPVFFLLMAAAAPIRTCWLAVAALLMIQPSLINLSLFERSGTTDGLAFKPHLNPGAVAQDWRMTRYNYLITQPGFLALIADQVYEDEPAPHPVLKSILYNGGLTSSSNDMILGNSEAYKLDNPRMTEAKWQSSFYRRVYVCDKSVYEGNLGWRLMEPPVSLPLPDANGAIALHCERRK